MDTTSPSEHSVECSVTPPGAVSEDQWRPIATAPTTGHDVLVFTEHGLVRLAFFDAPNGGIWSSWPGRNQYKPTHWMPLPAPPRAAINKALGGTEPKNSEHQVGE